jgi:hypothetical protein
LWQLLFSSSSSIKPSTVISRLLFEARSQFARLYDAIGGAENPAARKQS